VAKVFISSTARDLSEYREMACQSVRDAHHEPLNMEGYYDLQGTPQQIDRARVESADILIGILGNFYGECPTEDNPDRLSFTELEYRDAYAAGIEMIYFQPRMVDSTVGSTGDNARKLERFKNLVRKRHILKLVEDRNDLGRQVLLALQEYDKISNSDVYVCSSDNGIESDWGRSLAKDLADRLTRRLKRPVQVVDSSQTRPRRMPPKLLRRIGCCVAIASDEFWGCERCRQEIGAFQGGDQDLHRLKLVTRLDRPSAQTPAEFSRHRPYSFPGPEFQTAYEQAVDDLASEIMEDLVERFGAESSHKATAYLADVATGLTEKRADLCRILRQEGYKVIPRLRPPAELGPFRTVVRQDIQGADLFIQILDADSGGSVENMPDGWIAEIARLGDEACAARTNNGPAKRPDCFTWIRPGIDPLKLDPPIREAISLKRVNQDDFSDFKSKFTESGRGASAPVGTGQSFNDRYYVYITAVGDDVSELALLKSALEQRLDVLPQPAYPRLAERYLGKCHALVLAYRRAPEEEVMIQAFDYHARLKDVRRSVPIVVRHYNPPDKRRLELGLGIVEIGRELADTDLYVKVEELIKSRI
jgi:hypothetical protein